MTGEEEMRARQVEAMATLLEAKIGYCVDIFGIVSVFECDDGRFVVLDETTETTFTSAREAAETFLKRREELQAGFDYECESSRRVMEIDLQEGSNR